MTTGTPTKERLDQLEARREALRAQCESFLQERRARGVEELSDPDSTRFRGMLADLSGMTERAAEYAHELERVGTLPENLCGGGRTVSSAGQLAPLGLDMEELRTAHSRVMRGETAVLNTRAFNTSVPLLPAALYPIPTFPQHEGRLVDRLPGLLMEMPAIDIVQVLSVGGTAAIVGEGAAKPELSMPATKKTVKALKLAAHTGVSWENVSDFDAFVSAVQNELLKQIIDLENAEIYGGDPTSGGLNGLTTAQGILTYPAGAPTTPPNNWDDLAGAIAALRTGPALAVADLLCLHPDTWAAIRTQKDTQGRYLAAQPDPSADQANTAWGVEVLQSTAFPAGEGLLLDTVLFGKIAVREALGLRVGFSGTDFTDNIVRYVGEERLNVAIERPSAICHITGLPTAAPTTTGTKTAAKK